MHGKLAEGLKIALMDLDLLGFAWFCLVDLVDLVVLHGNLLLVTCARSRTIPNEDISCTAWHLLAARD